MDPTGRQLIRIAHQYPRRTTAQLVELARQAGIGGDLCDEKLEKTLRSAFAQSESDPQIMIFQVGGVWVPAVQATQEEAQRGLDMAAAKIRTVFDQLGPRDRWKLDYGPEGAERIERLGRDFGLLE